MKTRRKTMKTKRMWQTGLALVTALCLAVAGFGFVGSKLGVAEPLQGWSEITLQSEYDYGQIFTVPARTYTEDGDTVEAKTTLVKPDGIATYLTEVKLDQAGRYELRYTAEHAGKTYIDSKYFEVKATLYEFTGTQSTAEIGTWTGAPGIVTEGLMVRLAQNESLRFNKPVKLSDSTKDDMFLRAYATPDTLNTADFNIFCVTLTDVADPSVYVTIRARGLSEATHLTYILAGASNQSDMVGYEISHDAIHRNNQYGCAMYHSFFGAKNNTNSLDLNNMTFTWDQAEMSLYCTDRLVADFDNTRFFNEMFDGFPSGYVYVSVSADLYNAPTANFCVTGFDGSADLTNVKLTDDTAPVITTEYTQDQLPESKVGASYPIPAAKAVDTVSGMCDVKSSVWYNYNTSNPVMVDVKDGHFITDKVGTYAIVYEASDGTGNSATATLWVKTVESLDPPTITVEEIPQSATAEMGDWVDVPGNYSVSGGVNITGENGTVTVTATVGEETTDITALMGFRPDKEGAYTVTYTVTDFIGQTDTESYTVTVTRGTKPKFVDVPELPKYFIVGGYEYTIPEYYATDYTSGSAAKKLATLTITDKDNPSGKQYAPGDTYVPTASANGETITAVYTCESADALTLEIPAIIPYENVDGTTKFNVGNYLVHGSDAAIELGNDSARFTGADGDMATVTFGNPVLADGAQVQFNCSGIATRFDYFMVTLTDMYDPEIAVSAAVSNGTKTALVVQGAPDGIIEGLVLSSGSLITLRYRDGAFTLDTMSRTATLCDNGDPFTGFPSGKVYITLSLLGVTEGSGVNITMIDNQTIRTLESDRIAPRINFTSTYGGAFSKGDKVLLPAVIVADACTPDFTATLTVLGPDRQPVKDDSGVTLSGADPTVDHYITVNDYGTYNVTIEARDTNDRSRTSTYYTINVLDVNKPTIEFAHDFVDTAKVGDVLVIPAYEAKDDMTAAENLVIVQYVRVPGGRLVALSDGSNSIKAASEGVYEFIIMVTDEIGNLTTVMHQVTVTK